MAKEKKATILVSSIPQSEIRWLGMALTAAIEDYFSDPENQANYEKWKKEKDVKK